MSVEMCGECGLAFGRYETCIHCGRCRCGAQVTVHDGIVDEHGCTETAPTPPPVVDTREALLKALREHVTERTDGGYMTDFVILAVAAPADDPDSTSYVTETSSAPVHARIGLLRYATVRAEQLLGERP